MVQCMAGILFGIVELLIWSQDDSDSLPAFDYAAVAIPTARHPT